jgi:DNA-binding MarR family transcriptional regulator
LRVTAICSIVRQSGPRQLERLLAALDLFDSKIKDMPIGTARAFLMTALHEGDGVVEIGDRLGMRSGTIARHLLDWSERDRHGRENPQAHLIDGRRGVRDRRTVAQHLNPDGRRFLKQLLGKLVPVKEGV